MNQYNSSEILILSRHSKTLLNLSNYFWKKGAPLANTVYCKAASVFGKNHRNFTMGAEIVCRGSKAPCRKQSKYHVRSTMNVQPCRSMSARTTLNIHEAHAGTCPFLVQLRSGRSWLNFIFGSLRLVTSLGLCLMFTLFSFAVLYIFSTANTRVATVSENPRFSLRCLRFNKI